MGRGGGDGVVAVPGVTPALLLCPHPDKPLNPGLLWTPAGPGARLLFWERDSALPAEPNAALMQSESGSKLERSKREGFSTDEPN